MSRNVLKGRHLKKLGQHTRYEPKANMRRRFLFKNICLPSDNICMRGNICLPKVQTARHFYQAICYILIKSQCFHNDNFHDFLEKRDFHPTPPNRLEWSSQAQNIVAQYLGSTRHSGHVYIYVVRFYRQGQNSCTDTVSHCYVFDIGSSALCTYS